MDWKLEKCVRYLYVLELSHGKFYVGQAKDPDKRIRKHFSGSGSQWTRLHPPLKELMRKPLEDVDYRAGELAENEIVLDLMRRHGYENVRGGFFSNTSVEHVEKALISHGYGSVISTTSPSGCQLGGNDSVFEGICTLTANLRCSPTDPAGSVPESRQVKRDTEYYLFILKLEGDRYYVGYSSKPDLRIRRYFAGKGADWTAMHKPVEVLAKRSLGTLSESDAAAKTADATISMMRLFGWRNVRGAAWKSVDAETTLKQLRAFGYYEVTR
ncbi:GIY-YIG nuclease family protein [Pseudomonas syringae group genomosp. 7]|uniref:GIY-YIG nuclease family protein n=1 Tax=Pseudomonas syringae group genomosp. 7 TaxID=251699 RepID=UPI000EFE926C|nr:GIY-YIG nuclease family protein [Pseudomonas syringae group genomosp. 7]RMR10065.1 Excinuclease ABC C subunit domain protein [Pseudomonas syringae pv. helianthi]